MPVPDFQSVMRPMLELLADGQTRATADLAEMIGDHFSLSEEERTETVPSGRQTKLYTRVSWVVTHLVQAGLLQRPERGQVRITPAGTEAIGTLPAKITVKDLEGFLSYAEFRRRSKARPGDDGGDDDSEGPVDDWEELVSWAVRVQPDLTSMEADNDRRRDLAEQMLIARSLFLDGEVEWRHHVSDALGSTNLMNWRPVAQIRERLGRDEDALESAIDVLWRDGAGSPESAVASLDEFAGRINASGLSLAPGDVVALGSILLLALDADAWPPYVATPVRSWCALVGQTARRDTASGRYGQLVGLCDELLERGRPAGLGVSTRVEAQGLVWALLKHPVMGLGLTPEERVAFALWRDGKVPDDEVHAGAEEDEEEADGPAQTPPAGPPVGPVRKVPPLPVVSEQLASDLHMAREDLDEIVSVWAKRQQVVFFGPPGTGKTYLARALADHVTGGGDGWELVQFHPSYSYEDFMEGYRPSHGPDGQAHFTLKPGPLRRIAERASRAENADKPFVLIIDEMNRANLAKVFGELYFLLEYRNESMSLQYSDTEFALPKNLFIIGTMNTADRSIAMIDAAIRRRFAFIELHPAEAPVAGLLGRALPEGDPRGPLLEALNGLIGPDDRDLQVGPSYLMRPEAEDEKGLERIWRFDILPLLEEHYVGRRTRGEVHEQFCLDAVRRRAGLHPDGEGEGAQGESDGVDVEAVAEAEGVDPAVLRALLGIMDARQSAGSGS